MSTSDATEPSSLTKDIGKSVEEPDIEKGYEDLEVCMGDLLEGLEIDIVRYSEIDELSDDQADKLWADTTDIALVEMCSSCELILVAVTDTPMYSTNVYKLITDDADAFKAELRAHIKAIISAD